MKPQIFVCALMLNAACAVTYPSEASKGDRVAMDVLLSLSEEQKAFFRKHGRYGSLDELDRLNSSVARTLKRRNSRGFGYTFQLSVKGFRAIATPDRFLSTGNRSFYLDETFVLRGRLGDKPADGGSPPVVIR